MPRFTILSAAMFWGDEAVEIGQADANKSPIPVEPDDLSVLVVQLHGPGDGVGKCGNNCLSISYRPNGAAACCRVRQSFSRPGCEITADRLN